MTKLLTTEVGRLRLVSLLEGASYLVLIGIAVPIKYCMGDPAFVRLMGRIHGGLFILFLIALARVTVTVPWGWRRVLSAFAAAVVPFGALWLERKLRTGESLP